MDIKYHLSENLCSFFGIPSTNLISKQECQTMLHSYLHDNQYRITRELALLLHIGNGCSISDVYTNMFKLLVPIKCDAVFILTHIISNQEHTICIEYDSIRMLLMHNTLHNDTWYGFHIDFDTRLKTANLIKIRSLVDMLREHTVVELHVCDDKNEASKNFSKKLLDLGFDKGEGGFWYPGQDQDAASDND